MNGLVMYDRETGSLWSQVIGQGVDGRFGGTLLQVVPALQTTWQRWLEDHPTTMVLDSGERIGSDSYRGYYRDSSKGILGETRSDDRLDPKDLVVGVTVDGASMAYPFDALRFTPVVNDVFNGVPLVVTFEGDSSTGAVFSPMVKGERLTFHQVPGAEEFLMADLETGTVWDPLNGIGREGPLKGTSLQRVASHYEFWFAWKDFRPGTELYQPPTD